jgi:diguanylate cyclase (GGDEF)-like protein
MSFRGRLRFFFTSMVIVPMIGVAVVLFVLTRESETGKADAAIAGALRNAFVVYGDATGLARPQLREVAADQSLRDALAAGNPSAARREMDALRRAKPRIAAIELYDPDGRLLAQAGSSDGIAAAMLPVAKAGGRRIGTLSVSVTRSGAFIRRVARLSGMGVTVFRDGRRLGSTLRDGKGSPERGETGRSHDFSLNGEDYRGRLDEIPAAVGPPVQIAVFDPTAEIGAPLGGSRLVIGAILLAFLLFALLLSGRVVRALQGQVGQFLGAAKRLAAGDFKQPVPIHGHDEFAALGQEFNSMSGQLEAKIEEVERKRQELEDTIRRVGAAFASGLDRQGIVNLAVVTAVDACEADAGRALPLDAEAFHQTDIGAGHAELEAALTAAERKAFLVRPDSGVDLLEGIDPAVRPLQRHAVETSTDGAHALAVPMRARIGPSGTPQYVGVVSIARREQAFKRQDVELLEYLASQAAVSIENADLHETVQRQAVTDELTGLANVRELHATLDRELERSRRFGGTLGLMMLDIDDFKRVNDEFGHQQGDEVLSAVASVLREHSRDIDEPARYGGEELAVVLPQTDVEGAVQLAERMCEAIEALKVARVNSSGHLTVTASFGVASFPGSGGDKHALIAAADAALYRAKRAGKNQVQRAEPLAAPR